MAKKVTRIKASDTPKEQEPSQELVTKKKIAVSDKKQEKAKLKEKKEKEQQQQMYPGKMPPPAK